MSAETDTGAGDERAVIELDPDDMGTSEVQGNGTLYVGREYAGEAVRWVLERTDDTEEARGK